MIGQILAMLLTPFGMFAFAGGLLLFFMLPMVPRVLNIFHRLSHVHLWLGARMLKRAAVVIAEQGDLLLKRMSPNDVGTEEIEFADDTKEFEDPHQAKSNWMGISFAFGDEAHGILFSLRDAAIGRREKQAEESDELVIKATEQEKEMYEVFGWQKAVYEFKEGVHELVNLNHIRQLMTGSERGEHPQRVKTYYKNSRVPYQNGPSTARLILLLVALIAPFGACFFIWQQVTNSGGGGGSTIVGFMALGLASSGEITDRIKEWFNNTDWHYVAERTAAWMIHTTKVSLVVLPLPLLFGALAYFGSPMFSLLLFIIMAMGFLFIPILVEILKISDGITQSLATMLIKMGLMAYRTPVFEETPRGYTIREYSQLEEVDENNVAWHPLLGREFGFTFSPSPEMWGTELADKEELKATTLTDGGDPLADPSENGHRNAKTNIPSGYSIIPEKQRAMYGSMVPARIIDNKYYLWTGVALHRFAHVATGQKTFKRLEKSKEEFGEDDGMTDKSLITAMGVLGSLSLVAGIIVFFVLIGV